jgi:hypothetical protein
VAGCGTQYTVEVLVDCRRLAVLSYQVMPLMFHGVDKVPATACTCLHVKEFGGGVPFAEPQGS